MKKKIDEQPVVENEGEDEVLTKKKKGARVANTIINVILVIAIIIAAVCTYVSFVSTSGNGVPSLFGIEILSIQTESMYPTLEPGDLIFDRRVKDTSTLKIGDIITYWTVIDGERVLNTHRIFQIYDGGNYRIYETKGDNNEAEDPLTVHEAEIVGRYNGKRLKGAGKVFDFLQTSKGFLIVVVVPVALFFIFHLIQFFRVLFEYQGVKNRLIYEQERGKSEDILDEEKKKFEEEKAKERERLEAELRERLKAEILASGVISENTDNKPAEEKSAEEDEEKFRAETEARIRAELEEKARKEAEEAEKAAIRAKMEAEIRAKIMAEMKQKAEESKDGQTEGTDDGTEA